MASRWFLVMALVAVARADYTCICNYNVELDVFSAMNVSAPTIGSLFEFDCKASLTTMSVDSGWIAIAFQHHVGYLKTGQDVETQVCSGEAPDADKVPATTTPGPETSPTSQGTFLPSTSIATTRPTTQLSTATTTPPTPVRTTSPTTTTTAATTPSPTVTTATNTPSITIQTNTTSKFTTKMPSTTTASQTTLGGIISGQMNLCPVALRSFTAKDNGLLAQYDKSCYELVPHAHTWTYAEKDCTSKGGHLVQINTQGEQDFIYQLIKTNNNHNTWIGLHDLHKEGQYEWASGESPVYTNWVSGTPPQHSSQDCIFMNVKDGGGKWDDHTCSSGGFLSLAPTSSAPYICQYDIDESTMVNGTVNPHGDGNTHLCSSDVVSHATKYHTVLGQYGQNCYELLPSPRYDITWSHAESLCKLRGGHLASINNADEQSFLHDFLINHMPNHGAWIGLNDRSTEGQYEWSSGAPVAYTNWVKGHSGSIYDDPGHDDCALFLPYAGGHWDDLPCGSRGLFGDRGETHPAICQYHTSGGSPAVG